MSGAELGTSPLDRPGTCQQRLLTSPRLGPGPRSSDHRTHVRQALPERGQRVAIIGCGTSYFMAQSFAYLRERSGDGETDAFPASEFPTGRSYDALVALTRSGTTTEVLRLLETVRNGPGPRTVAITADRAHRSSS